MSDTTRTLEMPAIIAASPEPDDHPLDGSEPAYVEAQPTTLTLPVVGSADTIVVDEPEPGVRSLASLTLSARRARLALLTLALGAFATGANEGTIVAMSPAIARGLGVPVAQIGLLVTAFAATVVIATLPLTLLTQRLGKRVTLATTFAVWTAGVTLAATATSLPHLAAGRIVSAAAHALFWAVVAPTAASLFAPHLRGRTVSRIMVGSSAAGVVGTPLITLAGQTIGWRVPYIVLAAVGVALAAALLAVMPRDKGSSARGGAHTRGDLPSTGSFARVLTVAFMAAAGMSLTWTYIVAFYTRQSGVPNEVVPVMFAIGGIVSVASTLAAGPFLTRRVVETVAAGLGILVIAWGVLAIGHQWTAVAAQVMLSAGWSTLVAGLLSWAMRHTPWRTDVGAAAYTVTMSLGSASGPLLGSFIVGMWNTRALPLASLAFTLVAVAVTAGVDRHTVRMLRVPRRLRAAIAARERMRERRQEWHRRVGVRVKRTTSRPRKRPAGGIRG